MDDFEKDIQTLVPVLISSFSFQSLSVESNVPVSEIFQKVEQFGHYCVQPVFLHFHLHLHDQILTTGKNPLVHEISHILLFLVFELEIGLNFVSLDVLDQESVGIVPGEEHISNDRSNSIFLEIKSFCPHQGTVGQVHSDRICTVFVYYFRWVRVVFQSFRHFLSVLRQHQSVHYQVLIWVLVENCS